MCVRERERERERESVHVINEDSNTINKNKSTKQDDEKMTRTHLRETSKPRPPTAQEQQADEQQ